MKLVRYTTHSEMMHSFSILTEMYPELSREEYSNRLQDMIQMGYQQMGVILDEKLVALSGIWLGTKLWCGKYLEIDNFIVSEIYRKQGVAKFLVQQIESFAEENKCEIIALDAFVTNYKAHRFYYDQGFAARGYHFVKLLSEE